MGQGKQQTGSQPPAPPAKVKVLVSPQPSRTPRKITAKVQVLVSPGWFRQRQSVSKGSSQAESKTASAKSPLESAHPVADSDRTNLPHEPIGEIEEIEDEFDFPHDQGDEPPIKVWIAPSTWQRNLLMAFLVLLFWAGIASLVAAGGWYAIKLILNPGSVPWLGKLFPVWNDTPYTDANTPQSLDEIRARVSAAGLAPGEPLVLGSKATISSKSRSADWLIPIFAQHSCIAIESQSSTCWHIAELRVYRPSYQDQQKIYFRLVDRLAIQGPEEYFVVAPLVHSATDSYGSSTPLPLNHVNQIESEAAPRGVWLQLTGEWVKGSTRVLYGQVVHYDPSQAQLNSQLTWTSPARVAARWQEVTGAGTAELVVNQTVGLESSFLVYQARSTSNSANVLELQQITLTEPAWDDPDYENGLQLASSGLWSSALQLLRTVKRQTLESGSAWSTTAQAQMDVIALHAQLSQQLADRTWSSPHQQITAKLNDGRWSDALQAFQSAQQHGYDVTQLLEARPGRLWKQIEAALRATPQQPDVQAWGVLVLAAQKSRSAAIAWLQQQLKSSGSVSDSTVDQQVQPVLNLLDRLPSGTNSSHESRLLGMVEPLDGIDSKSWLRPQADTALQLGEQQAWYRVRVTQFHDGQRWQRSPFTTLNLPVLDRTYALWNLLGLRQTDQIQIITWSVGGQPTVQDATVKALQFKHGELTLLVSGYVIPTADLPALALTTATLNWLKSNQTMTLNQLKQQPGWTSDILPRLEQELQRSGDFDLAAEITPPEILQTLGQVSVRLLDVTGDNRLDAVLALPSPSSPPTAPTPSPLTLIFSNTGELVYSDLSQTEPTSLVAIANLQDGYPLLILRSPQTYRLLQWNPQSQQFE